MNWKFWEWEIWKEDEPLPLPAHPTTEASHTLVLEDPAVPEPEGNPEAERIRQSLLAARRK